MRRQYRDELSALRAELDTLRQDTDQLLAASVNTERMWASLPKAVVEANDVIHYLALAKVEIDADQSQCSPGMTRDITITVSGEHDPPTGEVNLYDNGTSSRATRRLENGSAVFHVNFPFRSRHTFSARYSGDTIYESQPVSNSITLVVI
jgi:hypothetical protein